MSLLGVVMGHTVMATSELRDDVFIWSNLLTASPVFQALTWVFQIMPLFFFAGVAASVEFPQVGGARAWDELGQLADAPMHTAVPAGVLLPGVLGRHLTSARLALPEHVYEPMAGISIQLLWFLGAYVLVLAAVPLLARITTTGRLAVAVLVAYAAIAARRRDSNQRRRRVGGGLRQHGRWLIPGMLAVAYRRILLAGRAALAVGAR